MKTLVYLAVPYSHPDAPVKERRFQEAIKGLGDPKTWPKSKKDMENKFRKKWNDKGIKAADNIIKNFPITKS